VFVIAMSCMKRFWKRLFGKKAMRVLLLGLDAAGKTTILYQLMGKGENTVPTIGFNVETIRVPPLEFLVWDVSGQDRLRTFWRHYYHGTTGIVFVVDSHDVERLPIARKELHGILREEELSNAVLLIIANKIDLPHAVSTEQLSAALDLPSLGNRVIHIQPAVAQQGKGLREGLIWLAKAMKQQSRKAQQSIGTTGSGTSANSSDTNSHHTASSQAAVASQPSVATAQPTTTVTFNHINPYNANTSNHITAASSSASSSLPPLDHRNAAST